MSSSKDFLGVLMISWDPRILAKIPPGWDVVQGWYVWSKYDSSILLAMVQESLNLSQLLSHDEGLVFRGILLLVTTFVASAGAQTFRTKNELAYQTRDVLTNKFLTYLCPIFLLFWTTYQLPRLLVVWVTTLSLLTQVEADLGCDSFCFCLFHHISSNWDKI